MKIELLRELYVNFDISYCCKSFLFIYYFILVQQSSDNTQESRRNLCAEQGQLFKIQNTQWNLMKRCKPNIELVQLRKSGYRCFLNLWKKNIFSDTKYYCYRIKRSRIKRFIFFYTIYSKSIEKNGLVSEPKYLG